MTKSMMKLILALCTLGLSAAYAEPVMLSGAQMDMVAAGGVTFTENGFVCPVISTENVTHSPKGGELGIEGFYTIGGPDVTVPVHATNGDGSGKPKGPFTMPGDPTYSAIWSGN
jgi:hypothetical protein